jgi:hypothetical protein
MATIRIVLGIVCLAIFGWSTKPNSSFLEIGAWNKEEELTKDLMLRESILVIARSQIGVREATGNNDGITVEAFLKVTNLAKGNPWCAAFVSWVFKQAGYARPKTAWSPALFPLERQTLNPKPADVLGIYSIKLKRIAHCGLVESRRNNWIIGLEGNTNLEGSREGDGVYRKWRHIRTIAKFADWTKN